MKEKEGRGYTREGKGKRKTEGSTNEGERNEGRRKKEERLRLKEKE